jgi:3-dehydroquinate synthetase
MIAQREEDNLVRLSLLAGAPSHTEIILGRGLLEKAPELLADYRKSKLIIVSDELVAPLFAAPLSDNLINTGYQSFLITIPAGETAKTLETVYNLYGACHDIHVARKDVIVAVGGGMVGDIAGMLAGTYLRGLELVQVPTSLLAMLSSSFGGKGGVNFRGYKSLIGLFKHPSIVLADLKTLDSLPRTEFLSGLGELITVGVLGAPEIFESLESGGASDLEGLIVAAIRYKMSVVKEDPNDQLDIRAKLHLGHNFSHALERLSGFTLPHGLAVSVGLNIAARLAAAVGICHHTLPGRISRTLVSLGLPANLQGYHPQEVIQAIREKAPDGRMRLILPVSLGEVIFVDEELIPLDVIEGILRELVWEGVD